MEPLDDDDGKTDGPEVGEGPYVTTLFSIYYDCVFGNDRDRHLSYTVRYSLPPGRESKSTESFCSTSERTVSVGTLLLPPF